MNRPTTLLALAVSGATLVGLAACSSDSSKTSVDELSTIEATLPPGITIPDLSGLPADCQQVYQQLIAAMTSAYLPTAAQIDYQQVFGDVAAAVPAELQDDLEIMSTAFEQFSTILAANGGDISKPDVQAAIEQLATEEVNNASSALQAYFDATCPTT